MSNIFSFVMIKILKEETEKGSKEVFTRLLIMVIILFYFSLIPNTWIDENPPELISKSRDVGRWIIKETVGPMFELDTNKIEAWDYVRNIKQEIKFNTALSVMVTRANGTVEIIQ